MQDSYVADDIWPHISQRSAEYADTTLESLRMAMACVHFHPVITMYGVECFKDYKKANLQTSRAILQYWD